MIWKEDLLDKAEQLYESYGYNFAAQILSDELGEYIHPERLRGALRRHRERNMRGMQGDTQEGMHQGVHPAVNQDIHQDIHQGMQVKTPNFDLPLEDISNGFLVVADLHVPYTNMSLLKKAVHLSRSIFIQDAVIAGDLFDFSSISQYPKDGNEDNLEDELQSAEKILKWLTSVFNRVFICNGNHDERLRKRIQSNYNLSRLIKSLGLDKKYFDKLFITDYDYLTLKLNDEPWILGHISKYNKRPGEEAMKIASMKRANVAVGHDHIQGYSSTPDGEYLAISIGSMIKLDERGRSPFWYKERRLTSSYPNVKNGFLIVTESGFPLLFNEKGSSSLSGKRSWEYWNESQE